MTLTHSRASFNPNFFLISATLPILILIEAPSPILIQFKPSIPSFKGSLPHCCQLFSFYKPTLISFLCSQFFFSSRIQVVTAAKISLIFLGWGRVLLPFFLNEGPSATSSDFSFIWYMVTWVHLPIEVKKMSKQNMGWWQLMFMFL